MIERNNMNTEKQAPIKEVQKKIVDLYLHWKELGVEKILQPLVNFNKHNPDRAEKRNAGYTLEDFQRNNVTGVWLYLQTPFGADDTYIVVIDEDVEMVDTEEKNHIHNDIVGLIRSVVKDTTQIDNMYVEKSTSGGYHIPIIVTGKELKIDPKRHLKSSNFIYNPKGIDEEAEKERLIEEAKKQGLDPKKAPKKVKGTAHIEVIGYGKNLVIAPSLAKSKKVIGQHTLTDTDFVLNGAVVGSYTVVQGNSLPEDAIRLSYAEYTELLNKLSEWEAKYDKSPKRIKSNKKHGISTLPTALQFKLDNNVPLNGDEKELLKKLRSGATQEDISKHPGNKDLVSYDRDLDRFLNTTYALRDILIKGHICSEAEYINGNSEDFVRIYSLFVPDGDHPDCLVYKNEDTRRPIMWDTHPGVDGIGFTVSAMLYEAFKRDKILQKKYKTFETFIYKVFRYRLAKRSTNPTVKLDRKASDFETYIIEKYIDPSMLAKIIKKHEGKDILLVADTGMGKTTSLVKMSKKIKKLVILAQPYAQQVRQTAATFNIPHAVHGVTQAELDEEVEHLLQNINSGKAEYWAVVTTFDSLDKIEKAIFRNERIKPEDCLPVIDEAHSLVTSMSYRAEAINNLEMKTTMRYPTTIYMTATPELLEHGLENVEKIKFKSPEQKQLFNTYYLVKKRRNTKGIDVAVTQVIKDHKIDTIDVIYENNIKNLLAAKRTLESYGLSCGIVYSEVKNSELFRMIIEESQIDPNLDVLLTTEVINDGININNENIGNIYIIDTGNGTKIRQFIGRFRKGMNNVYAIVTSYKTAQDIYIKNLIEETKHSVAKEIQRIKQEYALRNETFDVKQYDTDVSKIVSRLTNYKGNESLSYVRSQYNFRTTEFKTDLKLMALLHAIYNSIERDLKHPIVHTKWMHAAYGIDVNVIDGPTAKEIIRVDSKEQREKFEKELNDAIEDIYKDPKAWLLAFSSINNQPIYCEEFEKLYIAPDEDTYGDTGYTYREVTEKCMLSSYSKILGLMLRITNITNTIPPMHVVDEVGKGLLSKLHTLISYKDAILTLQVNGSEFSPFENKLSNSAYLSWIKIFAQTIYELSLQRNTIGYMKRNDLRKYAFNRYLDAIMQAGLHVSKESIEVVFGRLFNTHYDAVVKLDIKDTTKMTGRKGNKGRSKLAQIRGIASIDDILEPYIQQEKISKETAAWLRGAVKSQLHNFKNKLWLGLSTAINLPDIAGNKNNLNKVLEGIHKVQEPNNNQLPEKEINTLVSWVLGNDLYIHELPDEMYKIGTDANLRQNMLTTLLYRELYWSILSNKSGLILNSKINKIERREAIQSLKTRIEFLKEHYTDKRGNLDNKTREEISKLQEEIQQIQKIDTMPANEVVEKLQKELQKMSRTQYNNFNTLIATNVMAVIRAASDVNNEEFELLIVSVYNYTKKVDMQIINKYAERLLNKRIEFIQKKLGESSYTLFESTSIRKTLESLVARAQKLKDLMSEELVV